MPQGTHTPESVLLIGGTGRMGSMFAPLFTADGLRVHLAGPSDDPTYGGLVSACDVVIVSVPIEHTTAVIGRISPHLGPGQLLSDFTSIKAEPVKAMLDTRACVIGCHPLFAPMPSAAGQNVVLCPERPGPFADWYSGFFTRHGMTVSVMAPEEHDEAMAFIQGLTHFINIAFARTLQTRGANLKQVLQVCSPVYQVFFSILCRILSGDAGLYSQIQLANPHNYPVLEDFLKNGEEMLAAVGGSDQEQMYRIFTQAAEFLGEYKHTARRDSDFLIERMTEFLRRERQDD
ncbi:MAG: prephenate dehydrogenase/arogenate dehydrogenase family protein [Deltaproteobacteria bacterium]|nr:prephenate dehydrogenase/arogenate dehydrogenase family protein [Deltaproteobacteria bacterium]